MNKASVSFEEGLLQDLTDPEEAAAYLNAALEEGSQEVFLLALRDVAKASGIRRPIPAISHQSSVISNQ